MSVNVDSGPAARKFLVLACDVLTFALAFPVRHLGAIARAIAVPVLLGCVALYVLLAAYCSELVRYLGYPTDSTASLVLGIAAAAVLIMPLLHAITVAALAEVVVGRRRPKPSFLGISTDAWRIYTANMRLILLLALIGLATAIVDGMLRRLGGSSAVAAWFDVCMVLLFFWLGIRVWFFLVPASIGGGGDAILARSWRSSAGLQPVIGLVMLLILSASVAFLVGGECALRALGLLRPLPEAMSLGRALWMYQRNLWPFVTLITAAYVLAATLLTASRIRFYQHVTVSPPT